MTGNDRPPRPGRFAILRFSLQVDYAPTEEEARRRLSRLAAHERVGLVDRVTGVTRCRRDYLDLVMAKLEQAGTAPAEFRRTGSLGDYLKTRPRKA